MRLRFAIFLTLSLAGCGGGNSSGPTPVPIRPPALGDSPAIVATEPTVDRSTPRALLASMSAALDRKDAAALARLRAGPMTKPVLDAHDLDRARLDFLSHRLDLHWKRVVAAIDSATLEQEPRGDRLDLRADLGGNLGAVTLHLQRARDGWTLR